MAKKKKPKIGTMNIILIFLAVVLLAFTGIMIWLHITTGSIPDVLVTCFFAACIGEYSVMGQIKKNKDKVASEDVIENLKSEIENLKSEIENLKSEIKNLKSKNEEAVG